MSLDASLSPNQFFGFVHLGFTVVRGVSAGIVPTDGKISCRATLALNCKFPALGFARWLAKKQRNPNLTR
jgi:hypothetical protein